MYKKLMHFFSAALIISISQFAKASEFAGNCPDGYQAHSFSSICQAVSARNDMVIKVSVPQPCPAGFERLLNSQYCLSESAVVEKKGSQLLISENTTEPCQTQSHPLKSQTCNSFAPEPVEQDLTTTNTVTATSSQTSQTLKHYTGPACPAGFFRPPGVRSCLSQKIVYSENSQAPTGLCPEGWYRPARVRYCVPRKNLLKLTLNKGKLKTIALCETCGMEENEGWLQAPCPAGTYESWWQMPVYDEAGLFVETHVPTRVCIPKNIRPAS